MLDTILEWLGFIVLTIFSIGAVIWLESTDWKYWWQIVLVYIAIGLYAWWKADRDTSQEYWWK